MTKKLILTNIKRAVLLVEDSQLPVFEELIGGEVSSNRPKNHSVFQITPTAKIKDVKIFGEEWDEPNTPSLSATPGAVAQR